MKEIWKDIVDYEGLYQVSNFGRVKSLNYNKTGQEMILKPTKVGKGYLSVALYKDGKLKRCSVHRLVAQAFLENPDNLPQVNHKDENKENNRVENLEWITAKKNCNYRTRNERMAKAKSKPVYQFTLDGEFIREWSSTHEVEKYTGFCFQNISACCLGRYKQMYGSKWSYTPQENT